MNVLTGLLSAVSPQSDGDFTDRLNYCITTVALVVGSIFVSGWSFVGSPIQCWFPAYYKGWWMEYALDYCYVQNTYYIPMFENKTQESTWDISQHMIPIPTDDATRESKQIGYYQWVPFILAFQAFFFYLPVVLWRAIYEGAGFKVAAILNTCAVSSNMDEASREKNMKTVAGFLVQDHTISTSPVKSSLRRYSTGKYISFAYLGIKLLYVLNAAIQFFMLKGMLGVDSYMWGWNVAGDLLSGTEWAETGNFPRVTLCDYMVRVLGNTHKHTVQCVLMINMFNEKIFIAVWFWLAAMFALSLISFVHWLASTFVSSRGTSLVNNYIHKVDPSVARSMHKKDLLREFVNHKLRPDGVFLVRLVSLNSGDMVTCSLLKTLWDEFVKARGERPPPYSEPLLMQARKISDSEL